MICLQAFQRRRGCKEFTFAMARNRSPKKRQHQRGRSTSSACALDFGIPVPSHTYRLAASTQSETTWSSQHASYYA